MTKKAQDLPDNNGHDHLGQIRDIIFGEQKREFDDRIARLEKALDKRTSELEGELREINARISKSLEEAVLEVGKRIDSASAGSRKDHSTLRAHVEQVQGELGKRLELLTTENASSAAALRAEISALKKSAHGALDEARQALKSDLDSQATLLRNDKVSGEALADLLQELADRLRRRAGTVEELPSPGKLKKNP